MAQQSRGERAIGFGAVETGVGHAIQPVIADARAAGVEVFHALAQRFDHVAGGADFHAGNLAEFLHIFSETGPSGIDGPVGPESGQHAGGERAVPGDGPVGFQRIDGIIRRADDFYIETANQPLGTVLFRGQQRVRPLPDGGRGRLVQDVFDAENAAQFQVRPVIQRVANGIWQHAGVSEEFVVIARVPADEFFVDAKGAHQPPLVVIAAEHQMADVAEWDVFRDFLGAQVAVVIDDGHRFRHSVQAPGRFIL